MVNCIHNSTERWYVMFYAKLLPLTDSYKISSLLAKSRVGARICVNLLDRMVLLYDAEESSDGAKAFDYGYGYYRSVVKFHNDFFSKVPSIRPFVRRRLCIRPVQFLVCVCPILLFRAGNVLILCGSEGEVIAPPQTTLLKLLDSYLQSSQTCPAHCDMCPMLSEVFFRFSSYSQSAIGRAIGSGNSEPLDAANELPQELDLLLPKACEALVLVTQCIVKISLLSEEQRTIDPSAVDLRAIFRDGISDNGQGTAESVIGKSTPPN